MERKLPMNIPVLGRKKMTRTPYRVTGQDMRESMPLVLLFLVYTIGFLASNLFYYKQLLLPDTFYAHLDEIIDAYLHSGIFRMLLYTLAAYIGLEALVFFSGLSITGILLVPLQMLLYGIFVGSICGYLFIHYSGREVVYYMIALSPISALYGAALAASGKTAAFLSLNFFLFAWNKPLQVKPDLKKYFMANLVILIAAVLCAAITCITLKIAGLLTS